MGQLSGLGAAFDVGDIPVVANTSAASSGNLAATAGAATLTPPAGATQYVTGFTVTACGATAAKAASVTLTGCAGGTLTWAFAFPAGATIMAQPLVVSFFPALPASAAGQAIAVNLPSSGSGGTNAAVSIQGFWL